MESATPSPSFDERQHERLFWTIVDLEPECVKLLGRDGCVQMMNRSGLRMIEADAEDQVVGRNMSALIDEADRHAFAALVERVFQGESGSLSFQITGLKGGRRHLETHAVPLRDDRGEVGSLLAVTRDVTAQKRAIEALSESERKLRTLFNQASEGIFVSDPHGRLLDVNPAACQLTGYSRDELLQLEAADLVMPAEVLRLSGEIARLQSGEAITTECRLQRKNGTHFVAEVTAKRLPDGTLQAFARDITARKLSDEALRDSESRLRAAVRAGRVGLWDWDLESGRVYFSSEWKHQVGHSDDEISDSFEEWRRRVHPDDLAPMLSQIQAFLSSDQPTFESEFRFRHKDGTYRRILSQGSKVLDAGGHPTRVLGSHVDITERSELEAQFLQAQKMESIGRLAGGIAHDFNNLLTVINGMAELAIESLGEDDPLRPGLEEIRLAGDRAARLTRQLLALSRQQVLKPKVINLTEVVAAMESMLKRLIGEDVALEFQLSSTLDNVRADPGQMEQVILNLAVNARDAMPDGGTLSIETQNVTLSPGFAADHPSIVPGPHVLLAVSDSGIGMDDATKKRIFEPFFTTKEHGKGTGLGLSTVYGIVKQSGGSVWTSSTPGAGTRFEIYLPRVMDSLPGNALGDQGAGTPGHETILLVEDERALRDLTRRILESAGYTVIDAGSGEDALELLQEHGASISLVLTDVVMPGMNGRELAARVAESWPALKVLYTSGYTDDAILRHGVLEDERRFISKPYTPADLKRKVRGLLDD